MKRAFIYLKKLLFGILFFIAVYMLFSIVLSLTPVNNNFQNELNSPYEIWIKSNGLHLDIILPIKNQHINWSQVIPIPENIKDKVNYIGFGWGDKDFYINTPEWSDLKFSTAFRALFLRTDAAMHVTFYNNLFENDLSIQLLVKEQQFKDVQSLILESFKTKGNGVMLIENIGYGNYDRFYNANYSYSLIYTCNSWTNEVLKKAGLPSCVWTPFDKGILFQLRKCN